MLETLLKRTEPSGNSQVKDEKKEDNSLMGKFSTAVDKFFQGVLNFNTTTDRLSGNTNAVVDSVKKILSAIPGLGKVGEIYDTQRKDTEKAREYGVPGQTVRQARQAIETGVSTPEQLRMQREAGPNLARSGLPGETNNQLNEVIGKALRENRGLQELVDKGNVKREDLYKMATINQAAAPQDLNTPEGQRKAAQALSEFTISANKAAMASDKSVGEVVEGTRKKLLAEGETTAKLNSLKTQEQKDAFTQGQVRAQQFDEGTQSMLKDLRNMGFASEKNAGIYALMPGPANAYIKAQNDLSKATTEHERQLATAAMKRAETGILEAQNSDQVRNMARYASAFPEEQIFQDAKKMYETRSAAARLEGEQARTGLNAPQAAENLERRAGNVIAGKTEAGEKNYDLEILNELRAANRRNDMNNAAKIMGDVEKAIAGPTGTNVLLDKAVGELKGIGAEIKKQPGAQPTRPPKPGEEKKEVKRDLGTLGATGSNFEPKDIVSLLHKGERVLNPKENQDLSNLFNVVSQIKPKAEAPSLAGTLKDIKPPTATATEDIKAPAKTDLASDSGLEGAGVTLKDINDSLQQLNKGIMTMVSHTADMKDSSRETADMSGKLTGNRLAV